MSCIPTIIYAALTDIPRIPRAPPFLSLFLLIVTLAHIYHYKWAAADTPLADVVPCSSRQVSCPSGRPRCISVRQVCDGVLDCGCTHDQLPWSSFNEETNRLCQDSSDEPLRCYQSSLKWKPYARYRVDVNRLRVRELELEHFANQVGSNVLTEDHCHKLCLIYQDLVNRSAICLSYVRVVHGFQVQCKFFDRSFSEEDLIRDERAVTYIASDVDECTEQPDICKDKLQSSKCYNYVGGYECRCGAGYKLTGDLAESTVLSEWNKDGKIMRRSHLNNGDVKFEMACVNVNECEVTLNQGIGFQCIDDFSCHDTVGSFSCQCVDSHTDECANSLSYCHYPLAKCTKNLSFFACACQDGFFGDGIYCSDINECSILEFTSKCRSQHRKCVNYFGSYKCACSEGFLSSRNGKYCVDINECELENGNLCDKSTTKCRNIEGSYSCECIIKDGTLIEYSPMSVNAGAIDVLFVGIQCQFQDVTYMESPVVWITHDSGLSKILVVVIICAVAMTVLMVLYVGFWRTRWASSTVVPEENLSNWYQFDVDEMVSENFLYQMIPLATWPPPLKDDVGTEANLESRVSRRGKVKHIDHSIKENVDDTFSQQDDVITNPDNVLDGSSRQEDAITTRDMSNAKSLKSFSQIGTRSTTIPFPKSRSSEINENVLDQSKTSTAIIDAQSSNAESVTGTGSNQYMPSVKSYTRKDDTDVTYAGESASFPGFDYSVTESVDYDVDVLDFVEPTAEEKDVKNEGKDLRTRISVGPSGAIPSDEVQTRPSFVHDKKKRKSNLKKMIMAGNTVRMMLKTQTEQREFGKRQRTHMMKGWKKRLGEINAPEPKTIMITPAGKKWLGKASLVTQMMKMAKPGPSDKLFTETGEEVGIDEPCDYWEVDPDSLVPLNIDENIGNDGNVQYLDFEISSVDSSPDEISRDTDNVLSAKTNDFASEATVNMSQLIETSSVASRGNDLSAESESTAIVSMADVLGKSNLCDSSMAEISTDNAKTCRPISSFSTDTHSA